MIVDVLQLPDILLPGSRIENTQVTPGCTSFGIPINLVTGRNLVVPIGYYRYKIISNWHGYMYEHVVMTNVPIDRGKLMSHIQQDGLLIPLSVKCYVSSSPSMFLFVNGANYFYNLTQSGLDLVCSIPHTLMSRFIDMYDDKNTAIGVEYYIQHRKRLDNLAVANHSNGSGILEDLVYIGNDLDIFEDMVLGSSVQILETWACPSRYIDPLTELFIHDVFNINCLHNYIDRRFGSLSFDLHMQDSLTGTNYSNIQMSNAYRLKMLIDNLIDSQYTDIYMEDAGSGSRECKMNLRSIYTPVTDTCQTGYIQQVADPFYCTDWMNGRNILKYIAYKNWMDQFLVYIIFNDGTSAYFTIDLPYFHLSSASYINQRLLSTTLREVNGYAI